MRHLRRFLWTVNLLSYKSWILLWSKYYAEVMFACWLFLCQLTVKLHKVNKYRHVLFQNNYFPCSFGFKAIVNYLSDHQTIAFNVSIKQSPQTANCNVYSQVFNSNSATPRLFLHPVIRFTPQLLTLIT